MRFLGGLWRSEHSAAVVAGIVVGTIAFGVLSLIAWLLRWGTGVEPWYLASAAVDTAFPAMAAAGGYAIAYAANKAPESRARCFVRERTIIGVYFVVALLGEVAGTIRWLVHSNTALVSELWWPFVLALVSLVVLVKLPFWLIRLLLLKPTDLYEGPVIEFLLMLGIFGALIGGLFDTALYTPWLSRDVTWFRNFANAHPLTALLVPLVLTSTAIWSFLPFGAVSRRWQPVSLSAGNWKRVFSSNARRMFRL
jgi:hypothetical protein